MAAWSKLGRAQSGIIEPVMVCIPEGWFEMGCASGRDDEKPVHRVWVDTFEMAAYQVTNEKYGCFLAATGGAPPPSLQDANFSHPKMPVVAVSWHEATRYCEWLSDVSGKSYRLPTEAEWERAARGGTQGFFYPWGDTPPEMVPDYGRRWKLGPEPVGLYAPNAYGLYNVGDNVHEWCADWYDGGYYGRSPERNPQGPKSGTRKASRGGSWRHHIKVTRTAARSSIPPEFRYADYGFRIAGSVAKIVTTVREGHSS
ncbi:MAG TPA: SUMF1/EgtB/PvdO family nonheme iron enzyme [Candidatus Cybelea sp.]|nr:SUMF1/EgtB/PvdO family nonheme iron enzyme [Candidatus Cybelea sp.]